MQLEKKQIILNNMYKEYKSLNFNQIDQEVLAFWSAERVFERSISDRPESESFVFYEGDRKSVV